MLDKALKLEPDTANNSEYMAKEHAGPSHSALAANLSDFPDIEFDEATRLEPIAEGTKRGRVEEQDLPETIVTAHVTCLPHYWFQAEVADVWRCRCQRSKLRDVRA
jgi:hypothetical protein